MNRRHFLQAIAACLGLAQLDRLAASVHADPLLKVIPSSGEKLPAIGMGSFVSFNVGHDVEVLQQRTELLRIFFQLGGGIIDSSPMYGSSERNLGYCLENLKYVDGLFSATKVWTTSVEDGAAEIQASRNLWKVDQFDLLQVHNLLSWQGHLETLFEMKQLGRLRYVGVTTSHGRRHAELEKIMLTQPIDFVQATYNAIDREVEQRILPIARERGIAFIANRPFQRGSLVDWAKKHPLPGFAREFECDNWASLLLKFIVSHPAVTCAIPATTRLDHLFENMSAMRGIVPEQKMRETLVKYIAAL
ncbi:aldo/keto reductase [Solemya velum gill symbiont]|uniref:Aldo/keto reductase n=2 Tax=Solemya velum gill symbiont TaxID=2340 RepID=A0A1T2DSU9_SOVGS|nr:aldo/keto reductase [Solemya velum gill symbiont]OOY34512.1 aldo/keto reductase [Solemya velum gill symbiont]OOY37227.1 aldo/keto reductase [Solemya velum gill symbiont]OOY47128.1 aldo/keto reductase [Solemya velum gill symbiont]OOY47545.1 aldo/keto reductase [Solemya velum gill symbiont]OOY50172.1 aldo/keto reductase [Solemya velum gill symbiont]